MMINLFTKLPVVRKYVSINWKFVLSNYSSIPIEFESSTKVERNENKYYQPEWRVPSGYDTQIQVFNSVCRRKVPLILNHNNLVTWYCCGPTVYDDAHIGHAYCYLKFDIIRRILQDFFHFNVIFHMGITDIDDKIINRSLAENIDCAQLTRKYELRFFHDMASLNILFPTVVTRVTQYIPRVISFIQTILDNNHAYVASDGSVYFNVQSYGHYGNFRLVPVDQTPAENVQDGIKRNPEDFALWKSCKPEDKIFWPSPWGNGRPGWHIECSTMASDIFGKQIDIHSGGVDLMFPHHENEVAQSGSFHQTTQWANYWLHSGHLYLKNEKMSKSLKNVISIEEFLRNNTANEFRVYCLRSSLKNNVEFTDSVMSEAKSICEKLKTFKNTSQAYVEGQIIGGNVNESELMQKLIETDENIRISLRDNFHTGKALDAILDLISDTNKSIMSKEKYQVRSPSVILATWQYIDTVLSKFGIVTDKYQVNNHTENTHDLNLLMDNIVQFRNQVREFALPSRSEHPEDIKRIRKERQPLLNYCDEIRKSISMLGFQIKDQGKTSFWSVSSDERNKK